MSKRHSDALAIWEGACNPSGIARSIHEACKECIAENSSQREDAAVKLMVAQLAYVCGVWNGISDWALAPDSMACSQACQDATADERQVQVLAPLCEKAGDHKNTPRRPGPS